MEIKVLGMGCAKCRLLLNHTRQALQMLGWNETVEKVDDLDQILQSGVLRTPALMIDGQVVLSGQTATAETLRDLLLRHRSNPPQKR